MTTNTNEFTGTIIDNAYALHIAGLGKIVRNAIGADGCGELPEDIADLFCTMPFSMLDTKETRVIIEEAF